MDKSSGGMDKGVEMKAAPDSIEEAKGFRLEKLDAKGLKENERVIQSFKFDHLNQSKDRSLKQARELKASELSPEYLKESKHGGLYLVMDGDEVMGLVALRVDPGNKVGTVERILLAEKHDQGHALQGILRSTEHEMRARGCTSGVVTDTNISRAMGRVGNLSQTERFYTFVADDNEAPEAPLEQAA